MDILALAAEGLSDASWLIGLALIFGLFMAWTIGANDVANAMGTVVGSKSLTLKQAILLAAVLEFSGAVLVGRHVTDKIRQDIFAAGAFDAIPDVYAHGMLAALLAAATWLLMATYYGLPVSTTHSIVGAVVGFGVVVLEWSQIAWGQVGKIIASWIVSPLLAGTASFLIFVIIQQRILFQRDMVRSAKRVAPVFVFFVFLVVFLVTLYKGLKPVFKPLGLEDLEFWEATLFAMPLSLCATLACVPLIRRVRVEYSAATAGSQNPIILDEVTRTRERVRRLMTIADGETETDLETIRENLEQLETRLTDDKSLGHEWGTPEMRATEQIFVYLQILSACALAFAHGANDVANAVGPLAGVILVAKEGARGLSLSINEAGGWGLFILLLGGVGIVLGLATWGWRVIETIGRKITELTPTRGFAAEFGAATTILVASRQGIPISTTHTLVGAVLGVGFARGMGALNFGVVRDIFVSWVITLPAGALLTVIFYFAIRWLFVAG